MKKRRTGRLFGRTTDIRRAFFKSLASSLVLRGGITTTEARAKELRRYIEPLVTMSRQQSLANTRRVASRLSREAAKKMSQTLGPSYESRKGGYTRIAKLARRKGDGARLARIEFV